MTLTDEAIERIRELIRSGALPPGARLPPEAKLAAQLGLSRNSMREAVRALQLVRVLDARPGDGTYVTSLAPELLLEGLGSAIDLLQDDTLLDVMQVRVMLEPTATAAAARRFTEADLTTLADFLARMLESGPNPGAMLEHDLGFHRTIVAANGNESLTAVLDGLAGRTARARVWRALIEADAVAPIQAEHQAIYDALAAGDPEVAAAAALMHVTSSARWLRRVIEQPGSVETRARERKSTRRPSS
jgi:GntR family transcriptional regulator, transcriptional repressor for pyruvate dehydrogenase complex